MERNASGALAAGEEPDSALAEQLADAIQAQVVSGDLPIGAWLRQGTLAQDLGVSRTPIREALQHLHARGIVELIPNRGARVRLPTLREIQEAYVVRAELKGLAAQLATELISQAQLERLCEAERLFEEAVEGFAASQRDAAGAPPDRDATRPWLVANDLFHEVLQEASCNQRLRQTIAALHRSFPRNLTWGVLGDLRLLEQNVEQHRAIRKAVEERRPDVARKRMVEHVRRSGELIAKRSAAARDAP